MEGGRRRLSWIKCHEWNYASSDAATAILGEALWVTGGRPYSNRDTLSTTQLVYSNGTVESGPFLPKPKKGHCMVTMHDGRIILIGGDLNDGEDGTRDVFIYDPVTEKFTTGPSTKENRWVSACVLFRSPAHGNRPVVAAISGSRVSSAEIFDYTVATDWTFSKFLFFNW